MTDILIKRVTGHYHFIYLPFLTTVVVQHSKVIRVLVHLKMINAKAFLQTISEYEVVRPIDWQGSKSRSGPRLKPNDDSTERITSSNQSNSNESNSSIQKQNLWHQLATVLNEDQRQRFTNSMQFHLGNYVNNLSMDEIELMLREESTKVA